MAWAKGPGELSQIVITDGTTTATVASEYIEGYSVTTEKDSYDAAIGHSVDRGSMTKSLSFSAFKVDQIENLHSLMTSRAEVDATVTYHDSNTHQLGDYTNLQGGIIRITPVLNSISDVTGVYVADASTSRTNLASTWRDAGVTMDVPTISFSFPFDGTDGLGRPYFSSCAIEVEFMIPENYAKVTSAGPPPEYLFVHGATSDLAFKLPDGNFQVMKGGRVYVNYADEDASMPRASRIVYRAVADSWGDLLEFTDGAASSTVTEAFNASSPTLMQDYIHGVLVEFVGRGYTEGNVSTF